MKMIRGQTKPYIQGWHVVGKNRAPMWTPTFQWKSKGKTTRAWVLVPAGPDQKWCVDQVELIINDASGLQFQCTRPDGSRDVIFQNGAVFKVNRLNAKGKMIDQFIVKDE